MKKDGAQVDSTGKPEDILAYKQCVEQLKRQRASNPYTQCKARLGINKNEMSAPEAGLSYRQLLKKEMTIPKVNAPKANEIAPTIHAKKKKQVAYTAQVNKVTKDPVPEHVKENKRKMAEAKKTEEFGKREDLLPGMSFNQLKKMQTEEALRKPGK